MDFNCLTITVHEIQPGDKRTDNRVLVIDSRPTLSVRNPKNYVINLIFSYILHDQKAKKGCNKTTGHILIFLFLFIVYSSSK